MKYKFPRAAPSRASIVDAWNDFDETSKDVQRRYPNFHARFIEGGRVTIHSPSPSWIMVDKDNVLTIAEHLLVEVTGGPHRTPFDTKAFVAFMRNFRIDV